MMSHRGCSVRLASTRATTSGGLVTLSCLQAYPCPRRERGEVRNGGWRCFNVSSKLTSSVGYAVVLLLFAFETWTMSWPY